MTFEQPHRRRKGWVMEIIESPVGKAVRIYNGGYVWPLAVIIEKDMAGWLIGRHPDGQWVTLCNMREAKQDIMDSLNVPRE